MEIWLISLIVGIAAMNMFLIGICIYWGNRASQTEDTIFMPKWIFWLVLNWLGAIIIFIYWNKVTKNKLALQNQDTNKVR